MKINQKRSQQLKLKSILIYSVWALGIASVIGIIVFAYLTLADIENVFGGSSYSSNKTGSWVTGSTWAGSVAPPTTNINGDNILIKANHTVTSGALTALNGTTITVASNGTLFIAGDLTADNNLTLNISGSLIITGSLTTKNGALVTINSGGTMKVSGSTTLGQNAIVKVNGLLTVSGAIIFGSSPTFKGTGLVSTSGSSCLAWKGPGACTYGTLPVKLLSFNAEYINGIVKLSWKTASEENNNYFTIERTVDGINYTPLATIPGGGTTLKISSYTHEDSNPREGTSYYRLSQTDYNGNTEAFPQVSIDVQLSSASNFTIYPNPLTGDVLNISISKPEAAVIEIIDSKGNSILTKNVEKESKLQLRLDENITRGIYFVSYKTANEKRVERLVKN